MPLELNSFTVETAAPVPGAPLVIAHGLLGQSRNFSTLARGFAEARPVHVLDMRNHGDSPHDPRMDYPAMAEDLAAFILGLPGGRADVLGHSMGGKAAMRLALGHPECVARLIVADIAPVAYSHSHADLLRAMQQLDLPALKSRSEADRALAQAVPDRAMRAFVLQNLRLGERPGWKVNVDALLDAMDTLVGWQPTPPGLKFEGPTLFLSGAASDYVRDAYRDTILSLFPEAQFATLESAGHWLHAEQPGAFRAEVERFLA